MPLQCKGKEREGMEKNRSNSCLLRGHTFLRTFPCQLQLPRQKLSLLQYKATMPACCLKGSAVEVLRICMLGLLSRE